MRIVMVDDYEWWVGESVEACVSAAAAERGADPSDEEFEGAYELDEGQLDKLQYTDADENERPVGEPRTFRAQLAIELSEGGTFPRLFAATGY